MHDYEERFVGFIDILGFKDLIERSIGPHRSINPQEIKAALEVPKPMGADQFVLERIGDIAESGHQMTAFSDCIVITVQATEKGLFHLLLHIEKIGFRLIQKKMLCRGGIVKGLVFHDEQIIFGPAIIEAYHLEQREELPRIILSEDVIRIGLSIDSPDDRIFKLLVRRDSDGCYFVNILRIIRMIMDCESGPPDDIRSMCAEIDEHLLKELNRFSGDEKKLRKIGWFKQYFDWAKDRSTLERLVHSHYFQE